jgi:hypothetical protein
MAGMTVAAPVASASTAVPYTDRSAKGYIGLCSQAGHQVTSGSVDARPFVWRVVSSEPAPARYSSYSRTATLFGFVAMQELPPQDWGGEQLTASTRYSNRAAPIAQFTAADEPLSTLVTDYPPEWDGFYELRMFLGAADEEPYEVSYPALNIQVKGSTWYAVGGGPVKCNASSALSIESILLPKSRTVPTSTPTSATTRGVEGASASSVGGTTGASATGTSVHPGTNESSSHGQGASATGGQAASATGAPSAFHGGASSPAGHSGSSSPAPLIAGLVAAAAVVVGSIWYGANRRRRRRAVTPADLGVSDSCDSPAAVSRGATKR